MSDPIFRVVSGKAAAMPLTGAALGEALAREAPILLAAARAIVLDDAGATLEDVAAKAAIRVGMDALAATGG